MDFEGHYCVTLNITSYGPSKILKWDIYDANKSKLFNNNVIADDLKCAAFEAFYQIYQLFSRKYKPKFITMVTNWEWLIDQVYKQKEKDALANYLLDLFIGINFVLVNVFDTEMINEFYSN